MSREYRRNNSSRVWIRPYSAALGAVPVLDSNQRLSRSPRTSQTRSPNQNPSPVRSPSRSPNQNPSPVRSPSPEPQEITSPLVPINAPPRLNQLPPVRVLSPAITVTITNDIANVYSLTFRRDQDFENIYVQPNQIQDNVLGLGIGFIGATHKMTIGFSEELVREKFVKVQTSENHSISITDNVAILGDVWGLNFVVTVTIGDRLFEIDQTIDPTPDEIEEINAKIEYFANIRYPTLTSTVKGLIRVGAVPPPPRNGLVAAAKYFKVKRKYDSLAERLDYSLIEDHIEKVRSSWKAFEIDPGFHNDPNYEDMLQVYTDYILGRMGSPVENIKLSKFAFIGISEGSVKFLDKVLTKSQRNGVLGAIMGRRVAVLTSGQSSKIRTGVELWFGSGLKQVVSTFYGKKYYNTKLSSRKPAFENFLRDVSVNKSNRELFDVHGIIITSNILNDKIQWCRANIQTLVRIFRGQVKTEKAWSEELKVLIPNQGDISVYERFANNTYRGFFIPLSDNFIDESKSLSNVEVEFLASGEDAEDALNNGVALAFAWDGKYHYEEPDTMGRQLVAGDTEVLRAEYTRPWDNGRDILENSLPTMYVDPLFSTNNGWSFVNYYQFSIPVDADDRAELLTTVEGQYETMLGSLQEHRRLIRSMGTDIENILALYNPLPADQKLLITKFFHGLVILALRARQWSGRGKLPLYDESVQWQRPDQILEGQLSTLMLVPRNFYNQMSPAAQEVLTRVRVKAYSRTGEVQTGTYIIIDRFNTLQGVTDYGDANQRTRIGPNQRTQIATNRCMQLGSNHLMATSTAFLDSVARAPFQIRNGEPYRNIHYRIKAPDETDDVEYYPSSPPGHEEGEPAAENELTNLNGAEWMMWASHAYDRYHQEIDRNYDHGL